MVLLINILFSEKIAEVLKLDQEIHEIALKIHNQKSLLMMGRGYQFATCLEGALVCLIFFFYTLISSVIVFLIFENLKLYNFVHFFL